MNSNIREMRLAHILRALDEMDSERAEYMTGWKDRRMKLENELKYVRDEILTGQSPLPLEPIEAEEVKA